MDSNFISLISLSLICVDEIQRTLHLLLNPNRPAPSYRKSSSGSPDYNPYVSIFLHFFLYFQALYELEIFSCNDLSEGGLWACLSPRIISLKLADCMNISDEAIGAVAQLLPSLCEFSLQAYHVTDAALGFFSPKQSASLNILKLQSCWEITNHGIVNIGELFFCIRGIT